MKKTIITIDGPAGSGKELIATYIKNKFNFFHLDSGILYRRLAKMITNKGIKIQEEHKLKKFLQSIKFLPYRKHRNLRSELVSKTTSEIAKNEIIRNFVNEQQKKIIHNKLKISSGCVIDGRDIGSAVFQNAKIKLFIDTNIKIRAKRRHKQLIEAGEKSIYSDTLRELKLRDKKDTNRKNSPLVMPKGAIIIDNSKSFNITSKKIDGILKNYEKKI